MSSINRKRISRREDEAEEVRDYSRAREVRREYTPRRLRRLRDDLDHKVKSMPPLKGRRGRPNTIGQIIKHAALLAMEAVGEDGNGKDHLVGYMIRIAKKEPRSMMMLVTKMTPADINITAPLNQVFLTQLFGPGSTAEPEPDPIPLLEYDPLSEDLTAK